MRVLIIGAGLGGLTLAHGLRRAGIDVAVHERSPRAGAQHASYGIHVNADGARALRACLPEVNWGAFDASTTPAGDVVRFRDASLSVLSTIDHETPERVADPVTHRRAVRRDALHAALVRGLDREVHHDHVFESFRIGADGRVTARFADGTTDEGDLLVGADGGNSRVRGQRLPQLRREDLGILNVAGRLSLPEARRAGLPPDVLDSSMNMVVPAGHGWMFTSTWSLPGRSGAGAHGDEDGDLVWAFAAARSRYPDDVESRTPTQWRELVSERIADWAPAVRAAVRRTPPDTVGLIALRSMPTLPPWGPGPVTLLGDAVHAMTPMAGIGANTALRDADTLRRALTDPGPAGPIERIGRYEDRMRGYANDALALSTRNARNAAAEKRLPRVAFRSLLRLAEAVPPVKRVVFPTPA